MRAIRIVCASSMSPKSVSSFVRCVRPVHHVKRFMIRGEASVLTPAWSGNVIYVTARVRFSKAFCMFRGVRGQRVGRTIDWLRQ
jgi:hypothetical protein